MNSYTAKLWSASEKRDAIKWFVKYNRSVADIARMLDRTEESVQTMLQKSGVLRRRVENLPPDNTRVALAKAALRHEIEIALAEKSFAPPLKAGRLEWR